MYRIRPSKPAAVFGAIVGVAMIVFAVVQFDLSKPFMWLWVAVCAGIVGFNLWAAFAKRGAGQVVERDDSRTT
jgi:hypothetical protein